MENNIRYVASVLIETQSTIAINSGDKSLLLDNAIARDANGFPYIPGTSIAGVVHNMYQKIYPNKSTADIFGFTKLDAKYKKGDPKKESGSRIIFSSAYVSTSDGKTIIDGLMNYDKDTEYLNLLKLILDRDHVKTTDKGSAKKTGKFDRSLLYKGIRFGFEIELIGTEADKEEWNNILKALNINSFRIGAGTRNGSGKIKVIELAEKRYDLTDKQDLLAYLNKSSHLNNNLSERIQFIEREREDLDKYKKYKIQLKPRDFFLFGTSMPDADADNAPKKEKVIEWDENNTPQFIEKYLLPATSIKGALSHRTAYHYNLNNTTFIGKSTPLKEENFEWNIDKAIKDIVPSSNREDWSSDDPRWEEEMTKIEQMKFEAFKNKSEEWNSFEAQLDSRQKKGTSLPTEEENEAVVMLFGMAKDTDAGRIGKVFIDDIYIDKDKCHTHIFNHVKIDRFTGGAYDGALFQEKALYTDEPITLNILVELEETEKFKSALKAFEAALDDLKNGNLALGGATTKGYGVFQNQ